MGTDRGQLPARDIVCVLKLGQSSCKSLFCSGQCVCDRRREGTNLRRELGRDVQHEGNMLCLLQREIVVEKALRKGTETFT